LEVKPNAELHSHSTPSEILKSLKHKKPDEVNTENHFDSSRLFSTTGGSSFLEHLVDILTKLNLTHLRADKQFVC